MFQGKEYVYEVYKTKSFSKAAKNLFISQPSLSASVKRIETKIGYAIFDRSTKPLTLTECGVEYMKAVEMILSHENNFHRFLDNWKDLKIGTLTIGGSSLFVSWILPPLIHDFTQKYPQVKVELIEGSTATLSQLLQDGEIDLMIDNCSLDSKVFDHKVYEQDHLLLAVPYLLPENDLAASYQISRKQICDGSFLDDEIPIVPLSLFETAPFIMLKQENDTRDRAMSLLEAQAVNPSIIFQLDQQHTAYNVTCSGMGISFVSDTLITKVPPHANVKYYKLDTAASHRHIYFYWKAGRYFSRAMEEFLYHL